MPVARNFVSFAASFVDRALDNYRLPLPSVPHMTSAMGSREETQSADFIHANGGYYGQWTETHTGWDVAWNAPDTIRRFRGGVPITAPFKLRVDGTYNRDVQHAGMWVTPLDRLTSSLALNLHHVAPARGRGAIINEGQIVAYVLDVPGPHLHLAARPTIRLFDALPPSFPKADSVHQDPRWRGYLSPYYIWGQDFFATVPQSVIFSLSWLNEVGLSPMGTIVAFAVTSILGGKVPKKKDERADFINVRARLRAYMNSEKVALYENRFVQGALETVASGGKLPQYWDAPLSLQAVHTLRTVDNVPLKSFYSEDAERDNTARFMHSMLTELSAILRNRAYYDSFTLTFEDVETSLSPEPFNFSDSPRISRPFKKD